MTVKLLRRPGMSKSVRRFLLGNLWDFGKNESWFSDMALKGMHLQSIGSWFVVFEKGEPKKTRYRIEIFHTCMFLLNQ
jgi:hypothetical protein